MSSKRDIVESAVIQEDIQKLAENPLWESLSDHSLLITGATGMLGAYTALAAMRANDLYGYGIRLFLMGRRRLRAKELFKDAKVHFLYQDIRTPLSLAEPMDYIIHTAGPVGPAVFQTEPLEVLSANTEGVLSLLRHAAQYGCNGFVLASTHEVYGAADGEKSEDSSLVLENAMHPRASYVLGKQAAENAIACAGIWGMSARLSRLYGPLMNMQSGLFICSFLQQAQVNREIHIHGSPGLLRPLCYISDAVSALLHILVKGEGGQSYNVQGNEVPTILEIAERIAQATHAQVILDGAKECAFNQGHWLNTDKLRDLGWRQETSLDDGIDRILRYIEEIL